jgi:hypothetical protein
MVTAAHVIDDSVNDPGGLNPLVHHREGDHYYLIKSDDEGNWHARWFSPVMGQQLFLYPNIDLAIIHLDDGFYQMGDKVFATPDDYIRVDQKFHPIGTPVGVLGYPLSALTFEAGDINRPMAGNILLRTDVGVVNCRYQRAANIYNYEFTLAFNPGNSGGPIFDPRTGMLISLVHGFRAPEIRMVEHVLTQQERDKINPQSYAGDSFIDVVHANYSIGYATPSFLDVFREHAVI